jgi:hypothetical protein
VHIDLELVETRTFGATVYLHYRRRAREVDSSAGPPVLRR